MEVNAMPKLPLVRPRDVHAAALHEAQVGTAVAQQLQVQLG